MLRDPYDTVGGSNMFSINMNTLILSANDNEATVSPEENSVQL